MISPFKDLEDLAREIAAEQRISLEIYSGGMDSARDAIDRLTGPEVDVFISRGGTSDFIARHYNVPVVNIDTGLYDIMESCEEARRVSRNIAITSFGKPFVGMRLLEKAMDIAITELIFHSQAELEKLIADLSKEGNYCVVGGGQTVPEARKNGLSAVFLRASRDTIRDTLLKAAEVARLRREEKRRAYRLKTILDSAYDGIIVVDADGCLELMNPAAERMLGINAAQSIGRQANRVIPNTRLTEVLNTGRAEVGELQDLGSVQIVTNRVPIKDETEILGAVATFQDASRLIQVEHRLRREMSKNRFVAKYHLDDILGESPVMLETKEMATRFALSDLTLLIFGPSGSGKEMFAQGIHVAGKRRLHPFVAVNCAAIPPTLLESELFGYDEGAFTGARRKGKPGLFEMGHGGTVFLDEIDALPIELQGRLLRVLQEKEVLRIGGDTIIPVNVRVIAAANKQPHELVAAGKLREDLYYRLNVLYLEIPSLRERAEDIPLLCRHFLTALSSEVGLAHFKEFLPFLLRYDWPGNVRELLNFCQRLSFYQEGILHSKDAGQLLRKIAPNMMTALKTAAPEGDLATRVNAFETEIIRETVRTAGSLRKAAAALGVPRSTLSRKMKNLSTEHDAE